MVDSRHVREVEILHVRPHLVLCKGRPPLLLDRLHRCPVQAWHGPIFPFHNVLFEPLLRLRPEGLGVSLFGPGGVADPPILNTLLQVFWREWFRPHDWEDGGAIYERLGIRRMNELYFGGRLLNDLVSRLLGRRYRPFHGRDWRQRWFRFTVVVEIGHTLIFAYMMASAAGELVAGDPWSAGVKLAINVLANGYPVMIQRYNRIRLLRILGPEV